VKQPENISSLNNTAGKAVFWWR